MIKLCYKIHDKKTDEYYFDLQSQKVKKSFVEKYQYIEDHVRGIEMERSDLLDLYLLGRWNRRVLGIITFAGVVIFLTGMILAIRGPYFTGIVLLLLGGSIGVIFFHYGEFSEAFQAKKYFRERKE